MRAELGAVLDPPAGGASLIDALLVEQGDLSAVERFAQFHEDVEEPLQGRFYSALLPAQPPGPGQQLAFEVDLDRCSGCKACVAACHALNGLDESEAWRDVGLIVGGSGRLPVLQHVTSSCHHCLEPACLTACPVDAYEKDPVTGIVRHLDDQCFGCEYCTLACPYDAPKYNSARGIVRKCDMCADRLAVGEAPACVQACPSEAIRIRVVDLDEVRARSEAGDFLPTAPAPSTTLPTTRYVSLRPTGPKARPADHHRNVPEHVPASLVVMLVLTQAAAGAFAGDVLLRITGATSMVVMTTLDLLGLAAGLLGIGASLFHLGRPRYAYRALIGLKHSWLSREVAAFGAFAALATAQAVLGNLGVKAFLTPLSAATASAGLAGVAASIMVYHVTRRPFWTARLTASRFVGTTVWLGAAISLVAASGDPSARAVGVMSALVMIGAAVWKLRAESRFLVHSDDAQRTPLRRSAERLEGPLREFWQQRRGLAAVGGILLPVVWLVTGPPMVPVAGLFAAILGLAVALASETVERVLFFAAVVRPKMPGGVLT
jgi:Fe-S-cluster-containing dehydrogenase component/DMSO reductase anchor subunit